MGTRAKDFGIFLTALLFFQGYIFWPFPPPPWGEQFLSKLKYREEFEEEKGMKKGRERGEKKKKKEKSDKTHVKIPL